MRIGVILRTFTQLPGKPDAFKTDEAALLEAKQRRPYPGCLLNNLSQVV
jgi:hypothetical protein